MNSSRLPFFVTSNPVSFHSRAIFSPTICRRPNRLPTMPRWRCVTAVDATTGGTADEDHEPTHTQTPNSITSHTPTPHATPHNEENDDDNSEQVEVGEGVKEVPQSKMGTIISGEDVEDDGSEEGSLSIETGDDDGPQLEGSMTGDDIDQHFNDVLSKDWDALMQFDPDIVSEEVPVAKKPQNEEGNSIASPTATDDSDSESGDEAEGQADNGVLLDRGGEVGLEENEPVPKVKRRSRKTKATSKQDSDDNASDETKPVTKRRGRAKKATTKSEAKGKTKPIIEKAEGDENVQVLTKEEKELSRNPRWFFVQVKPGCEQLVAKGIRNLAQSVEGDDILDVLVPQVKTMKLSKGGRTVNGEERFFPGYILVLMLMNSISYGHIKRVTHVQSFMGDPNSDAGRKEELFRPPLPVTETEMRGVFERIRYLEDGEVRQGRVGLGLGDPVRVLTGSMEGCKGSVIQLKPEEGVLKCRLLVFGRETTVELKEGQVELFDEKKARMEEEERIRREEERRKTSMEKKRRRVDSSFGKMGRVNYEKAKTASAADDLAMLLLDDEGDEWDPEAKKDGRGEGKVKEVVEGDDDDGFMAAEMNADDEFAAFNVNEGEDLNELEKEDKKNEGDSGDDIDELLRGGNDIDDDIWSLDEDKDEDEGEENEGKSGGNRKGKEKDFDEELERVLQEIDLEYGKREGSGRSTGKTMQEDKGVKGMEEDEKLFGIDMGKFVEEEMSMGEGEGGDGDEVLQKLDSGETMDRSMEKKVRNDIDFKMLDEELFGMGPLEVGEEIVRVEEEDRGPTVDPLIDDDPREVLDVDELLAREKQRKEKGNVKRSYGQKGKVAGRKRPSAGVTRTVKDGGGRGRGGGGGAVGDSGQ